jgi:hypothetical protein
MNATDLSQLTIKELKSICTSHSISVTKDKRLKATFINAIESFQSQQTVTEIESLPAIPDPFEDAFEVDQSIDLPLMEAAVMASTPPSESVPLPTPQPPTTQHRQASIVMLVPLIMLCGLFIVMGISIKTLVALIAAVVPVLAGWWRYLVQSPTVTQAIDYEPLPV